MDNQQLTQQTSSSSSLNNNNNNQQTKSTANNNNNNKTEEIVLLEKQGRCSQIIRNNGMGNLAQVSHSVGQNMTDISNIGSTTKVCFFLRFSLEIIL